MKMLTDIGDPMSGIDRPSACSWDHSRCLTAALSNHPECEDKDVNPARALCHHTEISQAL